MLNKAGHRIIKSITKIVFAIVCDTFASLEKIWVKPDLLTKAKYIFP